MFAAAAATATSALTRLLVAHLIVELSCDVPCMFAFFISRRIRSVARPNCAPHTQEVLGHFCLRHIRMHTVPAYGWFLISLTQKHKVSHVSLPRARDRWVSGTSRGSGWEFATLHLWLDDLWKLIKAERTHWHTNWWVDEVEKIQSEDDGQPAVRWTTKEMQTLHCPYGCSWWCSI